MEKNSIPDWYSVLNLLDVVANDFVLDVVQHADTQKNSESGREGCEIPFRRLRDGNVLLVGMSGQMFLVIDVEIRISIVLVILAPVVFVEHADGA